VHRRRGDSKFSGDYAWSPKIIRGLNSVGNKIRGFLFDAGNFTVIDVPEAGFLEPQAINIWGQIVGVTGITQIVGFLATPTKP